MKKQNPNPVTRRQMLTASLGAASIAAIATPRAQAASWRKDSLQGKKVLDVLAANS